MQSRLTSWAQCAYCRMDFVVVYGSWVRIILMNCWNHEYYLFTTLSNDFIQGSVTLQCLLQAVNPWMHEECSLNTVTLLQPNTWSGAFIVPRELVDHRSSGIWKLLMSSWLAGPENTQIQTWICCDSRNFCCWVQSDEAICLFFSWIEQAEGGKQAGREGGRRESTS